MERTGTCFYLAIREDELCRHGEHAAYSGRMLPLIPVQTCH